MQLSITTRTMPYRYLGRKLVRDRATTIEVQEECVEWSDGVAYQDAKSIHGKVLRVLDGFLVCVGFQEGEKPVAWLPLSLHCVYADALAKAQGTLAPYASQARGVR